MENLSSQMLNQLFVEKLNSGEGLEKIAQETASFIRTKLREVSFARKIIPPQYVTPAELTRSVNHDGYVKIVDIEPDSHAMALNFRGAPTVKYIEGPRYEIPFFQISSEEFEKIEEELLAYEMPITDVIERNSVLDIQKIEDTRFITHVDAAIAAEGTTHISGTYDTDGSIKRSDMKKLFDVLDGNELRSELLLMDAVMYNRLLLYTQQNIGELAGQTFVNGVAFPTLFGRKLVVTNKVSLLGNVIYCFTAPEFFGQFLILNDTKFFIEKKKNLIRFSAYEHIGMGFGNTKAVAKLTLA